jgi:glycosyltransferase involved in cell wall biosynthesis
LALRQHTRWYASLFCDDYTGRGVAVGLARSYLRDCFPFFERIFCDNSRYPKIWAADIGVPLNVFDVLPFPYDRPFVCRTSRCDVSSPRILWAGRLDRQKRPDILARIAGELPQFHFDVHGGAVIAGAEKEAARLARLPNVTMHGVFQRLEDIVRPDHVAYLHTTAWEGLPTILFDVAAAGVPIVAPAVGGIPDFIEESTLVQNFEDVDAFAAQLRLLASSPEERLTRQNAQYQELTSTRSWIAFVARLAATAGYLTSRVGSTQVRAGELA